MTTQISELDLPADATPWVGPHGRIMERLELHLQLASRRVRRVCAGAVGS